MGRRAPAGEILGDPLSKRFDLALVDPSAPVAAAEIIRRLMLWAQRSQAQERADAASALARAYLYSGLDNSSRREAAMGMTALLDDASLDVRRALAEALASSLDAPHHIILALANDHSEISSIVLARSPVLTGAELVDCAAIGDSAAQCALAGRPRLGPDVGAAIAEVGSLDALIILAANEQAEVADFALNRMMQRFPASAALREAILQRAELSPAIRSDLVSAAASELVSFAADCGWLGKERAARIAREAREQGQIAIAADCPLEALAPYVRHLRRAGVLTSALLMRALICADVEFFAAALSELSHLPIARLISFAADPRGRGFASAYDRSGLSQPLLPAFRAALEALKARPTQRCDAPSRALAQRVLHALERLGAPDQGPMISLLRRLDAEAARIEARDFAHEVSISQGAARLTRIALNPSAVEYRPAAIDFDLLEAELVSSPEALGEAA